MQNNEDGEKLVVFKAVLYIQYWILDLYGKINKSKM